jgi:hypothetical protein
MGKGLSGEASRPIADVLLAAFHLEISMSNSNIPPLISYRLQLRLNM